MNFNRWHLKTLDKISAMNSGICSTIKVRVKEPPAQKPH